MRQKHNLNMLITGATGGIGSALAQAYAPDCGHMILHGRRQEALETLADQCRQQGAHVQIATHDMADIPAHLAWLDKILDEVPLDCVILNAGINTHAPSPDQSEDWNTVDALLNINLRIPLATANHLSARMARRGHGQIVLMSSLAAYHGIPLTPSYSASKAGIKAYGEALRGKMAPYGVKVNVVMPGYIDTPMAQAMPGPKPFQWQPERAARTIKRGIERNAPRIAFPLLLNYACWSLATLPAGLSQRLLRWFGYC